MTKKKYTLKEFNGWPRFYRAFFKTDIYKYSPEEGYISIKNINDTNVKKFIIWRNNKNELELFCKVFYLKENRFYEQTNLILIHNYEDRFEVNIIFNKKGKYKIEFYKAIKKEDIKGKIITWTITYQTDLICFIVELENDSKKEIFYPRYKHYDNIMVIEPIYDNLKLGEKKKFKFKSLKSNLDKIFINNGENDCHFLYKNKEGFFEKEIIIKGKSLSIGKVFVNKTKTSYKTITSIEITYNVIN